jgi:hypothetical protein
MPTTTEGIGVPVEQRFAHVARSHEQEKNFLTQSKGEGKS